MLKRHRLRSDSLARHSLRLGGLVLLFNEKVM